MTFLFRKNGRYGCKCVRGHPSRDVSAYGLAHPPNLWDQLPSGISLLSLKLTTIFVMKRQEMFNYKIEACIIQFLINNLFLYVKLVISCSRFSDISDKSTTKI